MDRSAQSTDAENSRAPHTATKPGDSLKSSSLGSAQALASTDRAGTGGKGSQDAVTASVGGGQP